MAFHTTQMQHVPCPYRKGEYDIVEAGSQYNAPNGHTYYHEIGRLKPNRFKNELADMTFEFKDIYFSKFISPGDVAAYCFKHGLAQRRIKFPARTQEVTLDAGLNSVPVLDTNNDPI